MKHLLRLCLLLILPMCARAAVTNLNIVAQAGITVRATNDSPTGSASFAISNNLASSAMINLSANPNQYFTNASRRITNYVHATSIGIDASTDVAAFVTNYTTANVSVLITNAAVGMSGTFTTKSDSSARTFSFFSDKLITMLSTNETLNSTQVVTTAGKKLKVMWQVEQSTNGTAEIALWAKSQP